MLQFQFHQLCAHSSICDHEPPHAHRQSKTPWPCAARIEIQYMLLHFYLRLMTVPVYHDAKSGGFGFQIKLSQIVQHVNRKASSFDHFGLRQCTRPGPSVDIAADRGYRRNFRERFEDLRIADVASVENAIRSAQSLESLGAQ